MDIDTLDATQAIYHDEFDDETDEDLTGSQKKPVAYLKVQEQKGLENKDYPVFEGDNIIGRGESCQVYIPSKSLSKEHACITVKSGSHLIYDKGSRNKTRRGKLFLSPDVRYELKHQNELTFADIKCAYSIAAETKAGDDTGSETVEEAMDVPGEAPQNNNVPKKSEGMLAANSDEEDYASDASSDILQPTQVRNTK
ncbi:hypothetical protein V1264_023292 [Littorina saxatilis]|uniref:FHA domain-containing protein n=1 Tax=Littorina saxatilis TaxID=31220 RepID=A0AAN9B7X7_9CAEN